MTRPKPKPRKPRAKPAKSVVVWVFPRTSGGPVVNRRDHMGYFIIGYIEKPVIAGYQRCLLTPAPLGKP